MQSRTFRLFLISGLFLLGAILASTFWDALGLGENKIPLGVAATIAFGTSIAGVVIAFGEIRKLRTVKLWIGLAGHLIVLGVFIWTIIYAMSL
jgi:hypothetical protein